MDSQEAKNYLLQVAIAAAGVCFSQDAEPAISAQIDYEDCDGVARTSYLIAIRGGMLPDWIEQKARELDAAIAEHSRYSCEFKEGE